MEKRVEREIEVGSLYCRGLQGLKVKGFWVLGVFGGVLEGYL